MPPATHKKGIRRFRDDLASFVSPVFDAGKTATYVLSAEVNILDFAWGVPHFPRDVLAQRCCGRDSLVGVFFWRGFRVARPDD
jgi:hypothetical protein